jgi:hypothetical protein
MEKGLLIDLDFERYGLEIISDEDGLITYQRRFDYDTIIEVWNYKNIVSIISLDPDGLRIPLANRYLCKTQEKLEFLLFAGRAGCMFDPLYFSENERSKII